MTAFWLVARELYEFVFKDLFGFYSSASDEIQEVPHPEKEKIADHGMSAEEVEAVPLLPLPPKPPELLHARTPEFSRESVYVIKKDTKLYAFPVETFDGVITIFPYGTSLHGNVRQGRWIEVVHTGIVGWVLQECVVDAMKAVFPQFAVEKRYDASHTETVKLRSYLDDMFTADHLDMDLQDTEYCMYKVLRKGKRIVWPTERPRIAGRWQQILKGVKGIFITVTPKTDSVMEVVREDGTGHVAYVEAVFPDQAILVSSVGFKKEGEYLEHTFPKEEWIEMRPIFIEIT